MPNENYKQEQDDTGQWHVFYDGHQAKTPHDDSGYNVTFVNEPYAGYECTYSTENVWKDTEIIAAPFYHERPNKGDFENLWDDTEDGTAPIVLTLASWRQCHPLDEKELHKKFKAACVSRAATTNVKPAQVHAIWKYINLDKPRTLDAFAKAPSKAEFRKNRKFVDFTRDISTKHLNVYVHTDATTAKKVCTVDGFGRDVSTSLVPLWNREGTLRFDDESDNCAYYVDKDPACGYGVFAGRDYPDDFKITPFLTGDLSESHDYAMQMETTTDTYFLCPGELEILRAAHYINGVRNPKIANVRCDRDTGDITTRCAITAGDQLLLCYNSDQDDRMSRECSKQPWLTLPWLCCKNTFVATMETIKTHGDEYEWDDPEMEEIMKMTTDEKKYIDMSEHATMLSIPYALASKATKKTLLDAVQLLSDDDDNAFWRAEFKLATKVINNAYKATVQAKADRDSVIRGELAYNIAMDIQNIDDFEVTMNKCATEITHGSTVWQIVTTELTQTDGCMFPPYAYLRVNWRADRGDLAVLDQGDLADRWNKIKPNLKTHYSLLETKAKKVGKIFGELNVNQIQAMLEIAMVASTMDPSEEDEADLMLQAFTKMQDCALSHFQDDGEEEDDVSLTVCMLTVKEPTNFEKWVQFCGANCLVNAKAERGTLSDAVETCRIENEVRDTQWGNASLCRAAFALLKEAVDANTSWVVLVSGDTLPMIPYKDVGRVINGNVSIFSKFKRDPTFVDGRLVSNEEELQLFFYETLNFIWENDAEAASSNWWCIALGVSWTGGEMVMKNPELIDWASQFMVLTREDAIVLSKVSENVFTDTNALLAAYNAKLKSEGINQPLTSPLGSPPMAPDEFLPLMYLKWHASAFGEEEYTYADKPVLWSTLMTEGGAHARKLSGPPNDALAAAIEDHQTAFARKFENMSSDADGEEIHSDDSDRSADSDDDGSSDDYDDGFFDDAEDDAEMQQAEDAGLHGVAVATEDRDVRHTLSFSLEDITAYLDKDTTIKGTYAQAIDAIKSKLDRKTETINAKKTMLSSLGTEAAKGRRFYPLQQNVTDAIHTFAKTHDGPNWNKFVAKKDKKAMTAAIMVRMPSAEAQKYHTDEGEAGKDDKVYATAFFLNETQAEANAFTLFNPAWPGITSSYWFDNTVVHAGPATTERQFILMVDLKEHN